MLPDVGDQDRRDSVRLVLGKTRYADLLGDALHLAGVGAIAYRALKRFIFLKILDSSGAIGSFGNAFWALAA